MEHRYRGMLLAGLAMILVGLVWIGQGLGFIRGSGFMVGDNTWALIGAIVAIGGLVLGGVALRHRAPS